MRIKYRYKILCVVGTRPNIMKVAPILKEIKKHKRFKPILLHTGQHYDFRMSDIFFRDLQIPKPDIYLGVGSGNHAEQTARIMLAVEKKLLSEKPDLVVVVGDVNSTLACALAASKIGIKIAHIEAGLRSFDNTMPEEINRRLTDSISDYLFISEKSGLHNLMKEGIDRRKMFFVGNVMIDTLLSNMGAIDKSNILDRLKSEERTYAVLTLHRPSNVDSKGSLHEIYTLLTKITEYTKIIYPIHPRASKMIKSHGFLKRFKHIDGLEIIKPLGYIDFIKLVKESKFVLTDSGGIQEEATVMKIPCLTMRKNTERPVTIEKGTNYIVGRDKGKIIRYIKSILKNRYKKSVIPKKWDGNTSERIIHVIEKYL